MSSVCQTCAFKNLLMPLFLMGCFPVAFQEIKRPLGTKSGKRPIKVGKRPIKEAKRPIKAMVLVGISVGCLMGCFRAPMPCRKTAPLKRPIRRSMTHVLATHMSRDPPIPFPLPRLVRKCPKQGCPCNLLQDVLITVLLLCPHLGCQGWHHVESLDQ